MDRERLFTLVENLRVLVRETGVKTYVVIESDGVSTFVDADKWIKFQSYYTIINTEFITRYDDEFLLLNSERLITVTDNLRVLVREVEEKTYVGLESGEASVMLNSEKWRKFIKYFPIICTEFKLRYEFVERSVNPLFMYSYSHLNNSLDSLSSESEEYLQVIKRNGNANNKKSQLIQTNSTVNEELSKCNDFVDDCCVIAQELLLMKRSLKAELSALIQVIQELNTYSSYLDFWLLMMQ